jgi:NADH-quinone oxidoreductase subunit N
MIARALRGRAAARITIGPPQTSRVISMFNPFIYLLFTFASINWFLIFTPVFQFASFNWFLIWTCTLSAALIVRHPFVDGFYFGDALYASSYALLVLLILTIFLIGYLYTLFNSSVSRYKELPLLFLIIYFGFSTLMISNDLLILYLSIELFSLTFYLITTVHQNYYTTEAGIKYFIFNFLAGAFYLLGCALIYLDYGSINFIHLAELTERYVLSAHSDGLIMGMPDGAFTGYFGFIFIIITFLFKLSIAPFHFWAPDIYQGALYPVTAFFTIFPKFVIATFLFKLYLYVLYAPYLNYLFMFCGLLSVFIGAMGALTQYNIKRLFAYSTISNAGFLIILIAMGTPLSSQYFFFYILTYLIANLGLFTLLIQLNTSNLLGLKSILGKTSSTYAILLSLPVLSLAGLPPLVGFIAKYLTIYLTYSSDLIFIAVILLGFSILSLFYYLRFVHYIYFYGSPRALAAETSKDTPDIYQSYIAVMVNIGLLFFSFNPSLLFLTASVFSSLVS